MFMVTGEYGSSSMYVHAVVMIVVAVCRLLGSSRPDPSELQYFVSTTGVKQTGSAFPGHGDVARYCRLLSLSSLLATDAQFNGEDFIRRA
jgi:hypothetical protein